MTTFLPNISKNPSYIGFFIYLLFASLIKLYNIMNIKTENDDKEKVV
jgi:hypothetical protein